MADKSTAVEELKSLKEDVAMALPDLQASYDAFSRFANATPIGVRLRPTALLKGHNEKVVAVAWSPDSQLLVSAGHDDNLIIWSIKQKLKVGKISTSRLISGAESKKNARPDSSRFVMCVDFSSTGKHVASGGLDDTCTIYPVGLNTKASQELIGHEGYISGCRFVDRGAQMLTASGDASCRLWDIGSGKSLTTFNGHASDVTGLDMHPADPNIFLTGSTDSTMRIWDIRTSESQRTFDAPVAEHGKYEVDVAAFHSSGLLVAGAANDGTIFVADTKEGGAIVRKMQSSKSGVTSLAFSKSGRFLFAGDEDGNCVAWDVYSGEVSGQLKGHEKCVAAVEFAPDGLALATGCFDAIVKVWS